MAQCSPSTTSGRNFPRRGGTGIRVIDGIDLDVDSGKFVAVIGPSGCGKSTLLQMAAGLLAPTRGVVRHRGRAIDAASTAKSASCRSRRNCFPGRRWPRMSSCRCCCAASPAPSAGSRVAAALDAVGLAGFEQYFPSQLSGGMQKRGSIARTLVYRPDVILMDEPFGALDAQTRMVMQDDLQMLSREAGATVLFVTHDITEAVLLADHVAIMSQRPARLSRQHRDRAAAAAQCVRAVPQRRLRGGL